MGRRTGGGCLALVLELVGNARGFFCMNLRRRRARSGAEEAMRSLGLVSRVVPGSRAEEVLRVTIVDNPEVIGWTSPVTVVGAKRFIVHAHYHSCVLLCAPSADELMFLLNWSTT